MRLTCGLSLAQVQHQFVRGAMLAVLPGLSSSTVADENYIGTMAATLPSLSMVTSGHVAAAWPPTGLSVTMVADWRSDLGVVKSGSNLSTWTDQSHGNVMSTSGFTPQTVVTNQLNGQPIIRSGAGAIAVASTVTTTYPITLAFVVKATGTGYQALAKGSNAGTTKGWEVNVSQAGGSTANAWGTVMGTTGAKYSSYALQTGYTACVYSMTSLNDVTFYTDTHAGERVTSAGATEEDLPGEFCLSHTGGASDGKFDLAHIVVFTGAAGSTDAATIISGLKSLWGLA